jgi:hypothetical protein
MRYLELYRHRMGLPPSDGGNDAKRVVIEQHTEAGR